MNRNLLIIFAVILLLCLAPMPYGYYILVRFVAMVAFGIMAWEYAQQNNQTLSITFGALALLFQPFIKIALGRVMWNIVDVAVAVLLLVIYFRNKD